MDYGNILSTAWEIVWKNKFLIILGFISALTTGGSGNFNVDQTTFMPDPNNPNEPPEFFTRGIGAEIVTALESEDPALIFEAFEPIFAAFVPLVIISFILGLILWVVTTASRAGLVQAAHDNASGYSAGGFGEYMGLGFSKVIPLLLKGILMLLLGIVIFGVLGAASLIPFLICLTGPLMVLSGIALIFTDAYAFRGIVLQDMSAGESLGHGWRVFRANIGPSLLLGLIFGIISAIASFVGGIILIPVSSVFAGPIDALFTTGSLPAGAAMTLAFGGLVTGVLLALILSLVTAWQSAGFTLAYRQMTSLGTSKAADYDEYGSNWEKSPDEFDDDMLI